MKQQDFLERLPPLLDFLKQHNTQWYDLVHTLVKDNINMFEAITKIQEELNNEPRTKEKENE